ncbi:nitric oxide reductase activation-like protein [Eubacterium sp.]|uniref:nitric oxide reductase activation-like protein n=1 Tax=Eubacterium sp. TaxID=142586 RepID=UPI002FCAC7B3
MADGSKWLTDTPEIDNRISNMMWTISGNYDDGVDAGEKSRISPEVALYYGITAGGRRRFIQWDQVKKFVISRVRSGCDKDTLLGLVQLASDSYVEACVIAERPGVATLRQQAYDSIAAHFLFLHSTDLMEKAQYATVLRKSGRNPQMDTATSRLLSAISEAASQKDTREMLRSLEKTYLSFFPLYLPSENGENPEEQRKAQSSDFNDFLLDELYSDDELEDVEMELEELAEALFEGTLDEGAGALDGGPARVLRIREEDLEGIYRQVSRHFGNTYLSPEELLIRQRRLCRGIHENCRIHMTDGVLRSACDNAFQHSFVTRHKNKNKLVYGENQRIFRRAIHKLTESIARTLVQEDVVDAIASDAGALVPGRLWRIGRSNNHKVFERTVDNTKGRYVVDVLIDASGSQSRNKYRVAAQAYILTEALTGAGIPTRVQGYSSFLDFTILKRFRDYESPHAANENIFEYFCSGNNRDGLAIKAVTYDLVKRPEENRILIVLSDGRPNDIQVGKGRSTTMEESYRGINAVRDTALEVRRARQAGIMVLGVYTGRERDLPAEKLIYGVDFAYIRDINRFSEIVIKYIRQIITI